MLIHIELPFDSLFLHKDVVVYYVNVVYCDSYEQVVKAIGHLRQYKVLQTGWEGTR